MAKEAKNKEKKVKDNNKKGKKHFLKDVKAELKKVIWPTPKQLLSNTIAVIVYALIVGVIVFVLDICFEKVNEFGIEKLKTMVKNTESVEQTNTVENTNNEENKEVSTNNEENTEKAE